MSSSAGNPSIKSCLTCSELAGQVRIRNPFKDYDVPAAVLVHQECPVCDEFDVDESQLCHTCAHIRPAHLLTCSIVHNILKEDENLKIVLGTLAELEARQNLCAFCRWCLHVVQADSQMYHYTIDDQREIQINRSWLHEDYRYVTNGDHDSQTYGSIPNLLFGSKMSRFSISEGLRYITIGHNKRLSWASGSGFATMLGLPRLKDFAAESPTIEWDTVRRWKAVCEQEHGSCCKLEQHKQLPFDFRLLDVESKSVIESGAQPPSFFALSYVWGTNPENSKAELRKDNLAELKQDGSLCNLPRTIAHAMEVCNILGQRYLWVDRLCIVQDDKVDKYGQIQYMEAIYSRADLVIVAACGDSMQSGLPGVHSEFPREQYQISNDIFGFTMANRFHRFKRATTSAWADRGWTNQEAVLARRKLYFTEAELWFECSGSLERENVLSFRPNAHSLGNNLRARRLGEVRLLVDDYDQYRQHVEQYSRRILTYPSDVYNAFRGIQDSFYAEYDVLFGLPESDFSRALLWYPNHWRGVQERQCNDRAMTLPSWSWASLTGAVTTCEIFGNGDDRKRSAGSFYCSLCRWATRTVNDTQERCRRINSINDQMVWAQLDEIWSSLNSRIFPAEEFHEEPDYRQFLALAWIKGCIEADVPVNLIGKKTVSSMLPQSLAHRWPTVQDFWDEVQNSIRYEENFYELPQLSAGQLATRTQSAALRVKYSIHGPTWGGSFCIFKTDAGRVEHIGSLLNMDEYQLRGTKTSDEAADVDFIALAVGCMPREVARFIDEKVLEKNRFHVDEQELDSATGQPGVIVMAVKWQGPVARRVALGWVTLQGWVESKPEFRTVILS